MSDAFDYSEPFKLTCPRCDCRFEPVIRRSSYFAKCPDCAEPVRVPASAEVELTDPDQDSGLQSDGETYRIARPPGWQDSPPEEINFAPQPKQPKAREEKKPLGKQGPEKKSPPNAGISPRPEPSHVIPPPVASGVNCPACGAKFETPPSDQPRVVLCPECLEDVHVPAGGSPPPPPANEFTKQETTEVAPEHETNDIIFAAYVEDPAESPASDVGEPRKKRRKRPRTEAEREPEENPTRREKASKNVFDTMAEVRQVEEDPPPEWTFFSGVTDFLIRPEVLIRWIYASVGMCVMGWLILMCLHFYDSFPIALPFFALPLIWIGIMSLSYIAANSVAILVETAGGMDKIEGWPEPVMKEQAVDLVYLSFLLIAAEVVSWFLGQVLGVLIGPAWVVSLVLLFLLYPIMLLSSLEANSPFVPVTLPIITSLQTVTWAWGAFYGLSGGLLLVWLLPLKWTLGQGGWTQFFTMIFAAPLITGWCFLYARLLGRLAWKASLTFLEKQEEEEAQAKPKKKRSQPKQKPGSQDNSESSGELQVTR